MHKRKSIVRIFISRIFHLLCFLILFCIANILTLYFENYPFSQIVQFLNRNVLFIVVMSLIFLVGEIFSALIFPLNLPAPLFNAIGSIFLLTFIFRIFELIESFLKEKIFTFFFLFAPLIYPMVFLAVLFFGYISIFARLFEYEEKIEKEKKSRKKEHTWEDVGEEFREATYDFLALIREKINKKRSR